MNRLTMGSENYRLARLAVRDLAVQCTLTEQEGAYLTHALTDLERELRRDGATGVEIIRQMLGMVLDGLNHGNWPWIKNGESVL